MESTKSYIQVLPGEEPVTWRDFDTPSYPNNNPFGSAYHSDPVLLEQDLENYTTGSYEYQRLPKSRYDGNRRYGRTGNETCDREYYRSGSGHDYQRPYSSYEDSYNNYYTRSGQGDDYADYSTRAYDYRGPSRSDDYNYYGENTTYDYSDGYRSSPGYSRQRGFDDGYQNSSEYSRDKDYQGRHRPYDVYEYR